MVHFAYPNVIPREGVFLGCGRYVAASFGKPPAPDYALVELNIPNISEVHLAALHLAPESAESRSVIYERRDPGQQQFRGESRDLAYVLALVSRTRELRLNLRSDLWCTGRVDVKDENSPFLKAVDVTGFSCKLGAFLAPDQPDTLFLVPAVNILPSHEALFQRQDVRVVALSQFGNLKDMAGKMILKVQGHELPELIAKLFQIPAIESQTFADTSRNPYRGLFVFREQDRDVFFGRETAIKECRERLRQHRFLALIGPSGSGKSSLMYAGVIPELRRRHHWHIIPCRLGTDPFYALAASLMPAVHPHKSERERLLTLPTIVEQLQTHQKTLQDLLEQMAPGHPSSRFLIFLDQGEELFTLCADPEARQRFVAALLTIPTTPYWHLALTMRADFLGKACAYRPLADAFQQAGYLVGPMNREELCEVIEKPATMRGIRIEEGLSDRILDALGHEPGTLPLLEFALSQLWEQQQNRTFTHAAYQQIGGVKQALALYAESIYMRLHPDDQEQTRRIFMQLIYPGEGTEDVKRTATRAEIGDAAWELVTKLADARLVVTGIQHSSHKTPQAVVSEDPMEETVEVVHEALIHGWQRLRTWLETEREFRLWQERLRLAIRQWNTSHQDDGGLLRGAMLAEAEQWFKTRNAALSSQETAYIQASIRVYQHEITTRKRQQRWNLVGLSLACLLAVLLAVAALYQNHQSARQRRIAEAQRKIAEEQRQIAYARQTEAEQERQRAEIQAQNARNHLYQAQLNAIKALSQTSKALLFSHDEFGALVTGIKAARQAMQITLPDTLTHQVLFNLYDVLHTVHEYARFEGHSGPVKSVSFSPDGHLLASASNDGTILLWDMTTGRKVRELRGHVTAVRSVRFSPDGRLLASGGVDTTVRLWDVASTERLDTLFWHLGGVQSVDFSPDGRLLASGSDDQTVNLWDVARRERIASFSGHLGGVKCVRFSPDGALLASGSEDGTIKLWDVNLQREQATLYGHTDTVWSVDISPDGRLLASGSDDTRIKLWYLDEPGEFLTLSGHTDGVRSVRFLAQGRWLASGSDEFDKTVKIWDFQRGEVVNTLKGHFNSVVGLDVHPERPLLASASDDHHVKVWNISDQARRSTLYSSDEPVKQVAFHPEGTLLAVGGHSDGTIILWDVVNDRRFRTIYGYAGQVHSVAFSPDGTLLASGNHDHTISLWEVTSGRQVRVLRGHTGAVRSIAFSPDGRWLLSGSDDSTVTLWDLATGQEVFSRSRHLGAVRCVAFSPDGAHFATAGNDSTIRLWHTVEGTEELVLRSLHAITPVHSIAFHPHGKILAAGGGDIMITLWDLTDGSEIRTLQGHSHVVFSVAFNPEGTLLASGSYDHTIKFWNLPNGRELFTLADHRAAVTSVQFHPNGRLLASGSDDGHVKARPLDLDTYIRRGCQLVSGYLTHNPNVAEENRDLCQDVNPAQ